MCSCKRLSDISEWQHMTMQVLANPTADIQEGPKVGRAELKARGVRPYDEKVQPVRLAEPFLPSVTDAPTANSWHLTQPA